ncbi:MAG: S41 family peptidase [Gemmatimonadaceae bacterium]|nr:S41 family peptidase [Chitinophagaceae bacterium]
MCMTPARNLRIWLPSLFAVVMICGMVLGFKLREKVARPGGFFKIEKPAPLQQVMDIIKLQYVDPINPDTLADDAISEMLTHLDPHSIFIPAVTLGEVNEDLQGNFQGIGVEFNIFADTVHVITVLENGPSDKAGLLVGDRFLKVNDSLVAGNGITTGGIKKHLRGPGGSKVKILILRGKDKKDIVVQRGTIPLPSVDAAYLPEPGTGFIHINKFSETTYEEFMRSLEALQKQGMKRLILDLRNNGGGILGEAIDIADEFLDGTKLIVYTKGNRQDKQEFRCKRDGLFEQGKLVLLVDEGSASASEVLAGALQDWDRATIIGRRTFGKGLVQEQFDLADGSALRLTVARYYTPSGRSIQKPYNNGESKYENDINDRYRHGEMVNADSNHIQNGTVYKTKSGRTVYGGGGIMPDLFIGADTSSFPRGFARLFVNNTMSDFAYRYFITHREEFNSFKNGTELYNRYKSNEPLWQEFEAFSAKDSIPVYSMSATDKQFTKQRLMALMARQQWRSNGFYEVINAGDQVVKKALEEAVK